MQYPRWPERNDREFDVSEVALSLTYTGATIGAS